jgi:hypothetical protein
MEVWGVRYRRFMKFVDELKGFDTPSHFRFSRLCIDRAGCTHEVVGNYS